MHGKRTLWIGGLAAILASTCCLGPLVLLLLGFSGAWIGTLTVLEPFRPVFIVIALVALGFAARRIFRPGRVCAQGEVCALPETQRTYRVLFGVVASLTAVALAYPYLAPLFY
ncbi:MAG: mercuric ion transporter MerT [Vicinamibacterales bacterium]